MRAECAWLASYEKDSARFKVCFCNPCSRHAAHCLVTAGMPRAPECLGEGVSMLALSNHDAKIEWHALVGMLPFHAEHIARVGIHSPSLAGKGCQQEPAALSEGRQAARAAARRCAAAGRRCRAVARRAWGSLCLRWAPTAGHPEHNAGRAPGRGTAACGTCEEAGVVLKVSSQINACQSQLLSLWPSLQPGGREGVVSVQMCSCSYFKQAVCRAGAGGAVRGQQPKVAALHLEGARTCLRLRCCPLTARQALQPRRHRKGRPECPRCPWGALRGQVYHLWLLRAYAC